MTSQQLACLNFIKTYITTHSYSPSYQQIADHLGLASKSGVSRLIDVLISRGHLTKVADSARSLVVTEPSGSLSSDMARLIKVYGRSKVAAEFNRQRAKAIEAEGARV